MDRDDIEEFHKLAAQVEGWRQEMAVLTKKSPDNAVNPFKLKLINSTLEQCNEMLGESYRPFDGFETFSLDEVPTNSDVSVILAQYAECLETLRADNIKQSQLGVWHWKIKDEGPAIRSAPPNRILKKKG